MKLSHLVISLSLAATLAGCKSSPTGRTQIAMYSEAEMNQLGKQSFAQMKKQQPINQDAKINRYVQCVADNVISVLPAKYANQQWEVVVFEEPSANAFALPGGKIGVHTGLLKVAKGQDQLATVLGHEVGHVIAEHSNERMTAAGIKQASLQVADAYSRSQGNRLHNETMMALGLGTEYLGMMPFSRMHESEADKIGLDLMAKAGFNPKESVELWRNMAANSAGAPPEFLSTHPSSDTRISDLRSWMPNAMVLHNQAKSQNKKPHCE